MAASMKWLINVMKIISYYGVSIRINNGISAASNKCSWRLAKSEMCHGCINGENVGISYQ